MEQIMTIIPSFLLGVLAFTFWSFAQPYVKSLVSRIKRYSTQTKQVDCSILEQRIEELEKKVTKRHNNDRAAIKQEIYKVLTELKTK